MASNPFTRFWRYLKALLNGKLDQYEDPEVILNEAVREMKDNQIKNRELAVQAITEKNNLQAVVDKEERTVAELEKKATIALQGGNRDLARQFLKEKALHEQTLENMRGNLAAAVDSAEKVKVAIRQEEDRIRVRTAEALAMKANLKQAQIQIKINKALDQFQFSENEQQWSAASDRIRGLQSEASARAEIASTSIDSRMREMEYNQMDAAADQELEKLENKLANSPANAYSSNTTQQVQMVGTGSSASSSNTSTTPSAAESEVDRQLAELEAKLNQK